MLKNASFMIAFTSVLAACSAERASPPASTSTELETRSAVYSVPVPDSLADAASFPVDSVKWTVSGAEARLVYDLPAELVGKAQRVALAGGLDAARGVYALSGEAGTAECTVVDGRLWCKEHLPGIAVDVARASELAATSPAPSKRAEVVRRFGVDPIGILEATLTVGDDSVDEREPERGRGPAR